MRRPAIANQRSGGRELSAPSTPKPSSASTITDSTTSTSTPSSTATEIVKNASRQMIATLAVSTKVRATATPW